MNQESEKAEITLNINGNGLNDRNWNETVSSNEHEEEVSIPILASRENFQNLPEQRISDTCRERTQKFHTYADMSVKFILFVLCFFKL